MNKQTYIENYGYISNNDFKRALVKSKTYNINIQDWNLPEHKLLNQHHIDLMIKLRLNIDINGHINFKDNFYRFGVLPKHRGVYAVNYTGHCINYNGNKFFGDYAFCIKGNKPINTLGEKLYYIDGSYPIYSITSCLEKDIQKVIRTNHNWWNKPTIAEEIIAYVK